MTQRRISFTGQSRAQALLAARKRLTQFPAGIRVLRTENVRADGRIYVVVDGDESVLASLPEDDSSQIENCSFETLESEECPNCGNVPDKPLAICPACQFKEIAPCPQCSQLIPRTSYISVTSELCRCPSCDTPVRLKFADPLFSEDGHYTQPLIRVLLVRGTNV
jgi:hypothetical protein